MRRLLFVVALAAVGCGQTTSGDDGGPDVQTFDQISTGCTNGTVQDYSYDASVCEPQLESTYSCGGSSCNWWVIIPCTAPSDAGDAGDDAAVGCLSICAAVQPPGPHSPPGFCQPAVKTDAGISYTCGGCGV